MKQFYLFRPATTLFKIRFVNALKHKYLSLILLFFTFFFVSSVYAQILSEDFSSGIPATWTVVDGGASTHTWEGTSVDNGAITGPHAEVNSWNAVYVGLLEEELITPAMDLSSYSTANLSFDCYFLLAYPTDSPRETAWIDYSTDGGSTWTNKVELSATTEELPYELDLTSEIAGESNVKIRFRYSDAGWRGGWWAIDGIGCGC